MKMIILCIHRIFVRYVNSLASHCLNHLKCISHFDEWDSFLIQLKNVVFFYKIFQFIFALGKQTKSRRRWRMHKSTHTHTYACIWCAINQLRSQNQFVIRFVWWNFYVSTTTNIPIEIIKMIERYSKLF